MIEKLSKLIDLCNNSVNLSANPHRDYYETPHEYIMGRSGSVSSEVLREMEARDTVVELQFYPKTSIGFYLIYHYDINEAIEKALFVLAEIYGDE